jgi:hypothetical protein
MTRRALTIRPAGAAATNNFSESVSFTTQQQSNAGIEPPRTQRINRGVLRMKGPLTRGRLE